MSTDRCDSTTTKKRGWFRVFVTFDEGPFGLHLVVLKEPWNMGIESGSAASVLRFLYVVSGDGRKLGSAFR